MINPTTRIQISTGIHPVWVDLATIRDLKYIPAPTIQGITTVVTWCDGTESQYHGQQAGELFRQWCQYVN